MRHRLDALNFFLADVRGGMGAFVSVFLLTEAHWTPAEIGVVLAISGLIGISLHAPVGAFIDNTRAKRALLVVSVALLAVCAIAIERAPIGPVVLVADVIMAVLGGVFAPTVAALTLGLTAVPEFAQRLARNAVFDRIGNIFVTGLVGVLGWWLSQRATFYLVPLFALLSAWVALSIPARAIDHERARGFHVEGRPEPWWKLITHHRDLVALAIAVALFHLANASMLPLVGQKLALAHPGLETALVAGCILVAQLISIPVALVVGARAASWGHKALLIAACLALLVRALIFGWFDDARVLVAAQVLDGVSAGILDVMIPLALANIVGGTGRYSLSRGIIGTIQGVGGSISNVGAGAVVAWGGYSAAFATLSIAPILACCVLAFAMTARSGDQSGSRPL